MSADEQPTDERSSIDQPRRPPRHYAWVIITTAIAVIGMVVGIVQVVQVSTRDTTNFSHLAMVAEPVHDDVTEWALNPTAIERSLPLGTCDANARDWLQANAIPLQRRYLITVRNSASEGPMLSLLDFRSTAPAVDERDMIHIRFVCDPRGTLPDELAFGRVDADLGDTTAQYFNVVKDAPTRSTPVRPVGFNLAPGESGTIQLELYSRNQAEGAIEVSVLSRNERRTEVIEGTEFAMPALLFSGEMYLVTTPEGLACQRIERQSLHSCTVESLREELALAISVQEE